MKEIIYTDNVGVYILWKQLCKEEKLIWSTRRLWNTRNIALWKIIYNFVQYCKFDITVFKIKSHAGNMGNELADGLSKVAIRRESDVLS